VLQTRAAFIGICVLNRMHERRSVAINDPVVWSVSRSVTRLLGKSGGMVRGPVWGRDSTVQPEVDLGGSWSGVKEGTLTQLL